MPGLTSSGRILLPSNGPIQVPAGMCFLVQTPNPVPGILDLHKLTSGGSDFIALLPCRRLLSTIAWPKPCKGQGSEYSFLQRRHTEKKGCSHLTTRSRLRRKIHDPGFKFFFGRFFRRLSVYSKQRKA